MVDLPTPDVSHEDVERVIARDFPVQEREEINAVVRQGDVREKVRVVLACLKNSGGDLARLKKDLSEATGYWREIIAEAEYPNTRRTFQSDKCSETEKLRLYEQDWSQYQRWLHSER